MKLGVSSYSFSKLVSDGKMSQMDVVSKAKEMGFDILEFSTISVPEGKTLPEFAAELRAECDRVGIEVGNYTIGSDFLNGSDGDLDREIERLITVELPVAKILRSPGMRHDATSGFANGIKTRRGFDNALDRLVQGYRAVTAEAKKLGIRTMVENHGFFSQDSDRVEKLINAVGDDNFGLLLDIGNFMCVDEDPAKAVGRLAPYAVHVHVKDFHYRDGSLDAPGEGWFQTRAGNYLRGAIVGHGVVPVRKCLSIIKSKGYDGVVSLEFEGMEDPIAGIRIGFDNLKRFWNEI